MAEIDGAEPVGREPAEGEDGVPVAFVALAEGDDVCFEGHATEGFFAAGEGKVAAVEGAGAGVFGGSGIEAGGLVGSGVRGWGGKDCGG